jgi:uncharacterized membrane protein YecN with MAPEG domain
MTTELFWLMMTAILASSLWIPFVIGVNSTPYDKPDGDPDTFVRPPNHRHMVPWVHRAFRAHQNLLEQFTPFAIIVLLGFVLHVSTPVTVWCSIIFFWLRAAHAVGMITAWTRMPWRPLIFTAGWVVTVVYAWAVIANATSGGA